MTTHHPRATVTEQQAAAVELRALAEAATSGPWSLEPARNLEGGGTSDIRVLHAPYDMGDTIAHVLPWGPKAKDDAAYIAAVSPDVVLGLLDTIDRLQGELDRTESQIHEPGGFIEQVVEADATIEELRAALAVAPFKFTQWVASNAAYNGASDPGQEFYDRGLNAWLPVCAAAYAEEVSRG